MVITFCLYLNLAGTVVISTMFPEVWKDIPNVHAHYSPPMMALSSGGRFDLPKETSFHESVDMLNFAEMEIFDRFQTIHSVGYSLDRKNPGIIVHVFDTREAGLIPR